jgi:hypothetical protein
MQAVPLLLPLHKLGRFLNCARQSFGVLKEDDDTRRYITGAALTDQSHTKDRLNFHTQYQPECVGFTAPAELESSVVVHPEAGVSRSKKDFSLRSK